MNERKLYRRASEEFAARVHRVGDRWDAPTPCAGWDVRALVRHVVEEERWAVPLLAGATIEEVGDRFSGDLLGRGNEAGADRSTGQSRSESPGLGSPVDPVASFDRANAAALTAVEGSAANVVHLLFGDTPRAEYVRQLAADHLVHAWDLARALGEDDALDVEAVEAVRQWFGSSEQAYRDAGVIGSRVPVAADADPQTVLLAMFGRARAATDALSAVQRFDAAFGAQDVDAIMAAMTPDCVFEDTTPPDGGRHRGAAAVRAAWEKLFAGSPAGVFTTEEIVVAGDRVVTRWCYDFGSGHVRGVDLFTVRDGLVAEKLSYVKG
jgi:uncharacterized protein (TIGR03083 family)